MELYGILLTKDRCPIFTPKVLYDAWGKNGTRPIFTPSLSHFYPKLWGKNEMHILRNNAGASGYIPYLCFIAN